MGGWSVELRGGEVDGLVLRAAAYDLVAGGVVAFDHDFHGSGRGGGHSARAGSRAGGP